MQNAQNNINKNIVIIKNKLINIELTHNMKVRKYSYCS